MTEYVRLGDVVSIKKGRKMLESPRSDSTNRYIQIEDLRSDNNQKWCEPSPNSTPVTPDDVIIAWDGANAGTIGFGLSGVIGSTLARISFKIPINAEYAGLFLRSKFKLLHDKSKGSTIPHIDKKILENLEIPLPPLEEQKRIAAALDKMSSVIAKRKRQIALLDEAAKSLFVEMFGDPVENPMGWEVDVLNNLGEIISGITKGRKTTGKTLVDIPYMRVANVKDGHLDLSEIKLIGATAEEIMKYALQKGDVLLTEGGDNDKLGRGALWKGEIEPCIHQNHIFRVRAYPDKMFPKYFAEYLKSSQAKLYFLKSAKQTTGIASINMRQLSALPVVLPPLPLQERFVERIGKLEQQKISCESGLKQMETAFAAMMQEYFG